MKVIRRWHSREFAFAGELIKVKLKALLKGEAGEFLRGMRDMVKDLPSTEAEGQQIDGDQVVEMYRRYDSDFARDAFRRFVKPDEPLQNEAEEAITTGEELFEVVSVGFVQGVLMELQKLCVSSEASGKGSASPSTSPSGSGGSSASPAPSTGSEACPSPSTATAGPATSGSSSPPA